MKRFIVVLSLLFFFSQSQAEVKVDPKDHIPNQSPGKCGWASIETLGRTHGYKQLYGITDEKPEPAFHYELLEELKDKKVKHRWFAAKETEWWFIVWHEPLGEHPRTLKHCKTPKEAKEYIKKNKKEGVYWVEEQYHWTSQFLFDSIKDNLGAAVTIQHPGHPALHMLVLTDINDQEVTLVDSNGKKGTIRKIPLYQFLEIWVGFAIVIEKK
jgi:hypothetical protein